MHEPVAASRRATTTRGGPGSISRGASRTRIGRTDARWMRIGWRPRLAMRISTVAEAGGAAARREGSRVNSRVEPPPGSSRSSPAAGPPGSIQGASAVTPRRRTESRSSFVTSTRNRSGLPSTSQGTRRMGGFRSRALLFRQRTCWSYRHCKPDARKTNGTICTSASASRNDVSQETLARSTGAAISGSRSRIVTAACGLVADSQRTGTGGTVSNSR